MMTANTTSLKLVEQQSATRLHGGSRPFCGNPGEQKQIHIYQNLTKHFQKNQKSSNQNSNKISIYRGKI